MRGIEFVSEKVRRLTREVGDHERVRRIKADHEAVRRQAQAVRDILYPPPRSVETSTQRPPKGVVR